LCRQVGLQVLVMAEVLELERELEGEEGSSLIATLGWLEWF